MKSSVEDCSPDLSPYGVTDFLIAIDPKFQVVFTLHFRDRETF